MASRIQQKLWDATYMTVITSVLLTDFLLLSQGAYFDEISSHVGEVHKAKKLRAVSNQKL